MFSNTATNYVVHTCDGISISKKVSSAMYNFYANYLRLPMYLI